MKKVKYTTTSGEQFTIDFETLTLKKSDGEFEIKMITMLGKNQKFIAWISKKGNINSCFEFKTRGTVIDFK